MIDTTCREVTSYKGGTVIVLSAGNLKRWTQKHVDDPRIQEKMLKAVERILDAMKNTTPLSEVLEKHDEFKRDI